MDNHYQTLTVLYNLVRYDTRPESYLCPPRDLILRHHEMPWDGIELNLQALAKEGLIIFRQLNGLFISITAAGIEKAQQLSREKLQFI